MIQVLYNLLYMLYSCFSISQLALNKEQSVFLYMKILVTTHHDKNQENFQTPDIKYSKSVMALNKSEHCCM